MSYGPSGQGMPYGGPNGRGYGNQAFEQGPPRPNGEQPGRRPPPQQRGPLQSESERRYVERTVQQLPESFRTRPGPQYEEDMHDYRHAPSNMRSPHGPQRPNQYPPPGAPRSPSNFQPPHRQFGNQGPGLPKGSWPARGDSAVRNDNQSKGRPPPQRERVQAERQQQTRRPDNPSQSQPLHEPGRGGTGAGTIAYPDYPGPAQHPRQPDPSNLDSHHAPSSAAVPERWGEGDFLSPDSPSTHRPITESSFYSQSSTGSIPDFPMPHGQDDPLQPPPPLLSGQRDSGRQMPLRIPLGPPPSSRRGPSSYYSQYSVVAPIVEEAGSRSSRGSNQVVPGGIPGLYVDGASDDDMPDDHQDGRTSPAEDHDDSSGLVRRASMGKKAKPAVIPVGKEPKSHLAKGGIVAQAVTSAGATGGAFAAGLGSSNSVTRANTPQPSSRTATAAADPSDSDASSSTFDEKAYDAKLEKAGFKREAMASMDFFGASPMSQLARPQSPGLRAASPFSPKARSPLAPDSSLTKEFGGKSPKRQNDIKMAAIMAGLEKGGAIDDKAANGLRSPRAGFGDKAGLKRPPRLNVDATREAEARGSLTSLPELIKRATRLASNLDRGKTASRLGMEWFSADPKAQSEQDGDYRKSASLSAILASFPPPGLATPTGERARTRDTNATGWPQFAPDSHKKRQRPRRDMDPRFVFEKPGKPKERRCCGMPLWTFILLAIVLLAIIVAAVVIPIAVVVIPKHKSSSNGTNPALAACQSKSPCQNGGSSILAADSSCSCLCTNGFTGSSCSTASDSACTSMAVAGQSKATVGSAIPRLLDAAQSNYSIPLDSARVLAQFSSGDVSCNTENALVTLNGQPSRRSARRSINNLFMPLPLVSNPFRPSGSKASSAATTGGSGQAHYFEVEGASWDDGQESYMPRPTDAAKLERRASSSDDSFLTATVSSGGGETVNGIIVATGAPSNAGPRSTSTPTSAGGLATASGSATVTQSPPATSATGTAGVSTTGTTGQTAMDFSRIVILFILQETGNLNDASDAQNKLSNWFANHASDSSGASSAAKDVDLGASGWKIDLADLLVTAANGTQYGSNASG